MGKFVFLVVFLVSFSSAEDINVRVAEVLFNETIRPTNATARSLLLSSLPRQTNLAFVIRHIGMIECQGVDHFTGGNFFERLIGEQGADFGGNYLCGPTCRGECIPNQDVGVAPVSLYPFGCRCAPDGCDAGGPVIRKFGTQTFRIVCVPDTRCTCEGMAEPGKYHVGYLCNWLNLNSNRIVSFLDRPPRPDMHPTYSPIRWCSCCPHNVPPSLG